MAIETLGEAFSLGWRVTVRCVHSREDGAHSKSSRECTNRKTFDMGTLVWTRGGISPSRVSKAVCAVRVAVRETSLSFTTPRQTRPPGGVMCNLYSLTKGQAAIVALVRAMRDRTGNLPSMPGVFPDYPAPIARTAADGVRELAMARWGMPGPPQFGGAPITNIRNVKGPHWRRWLTPASRCLVPFTSFCEYADTKPRKTPTWFALAEDRPLAFFAGIWTTWHGKRGTKANPVKGEHQLFGFLTTDANAEVRAIHPKAMPVILTTAAEIEQWLTAPAEEALKLQRPLPDGALKIVATGEKEDQVAA
jgi:putative SOS response-associated peptidase YedK